MHETHFNAVIFDFNGTLFWDTKYHHESWDIFLRNHQIHLTDSEKRIKILGRMNQDVLQDLFNKQINSNELNSLIMEKELIYQQLCLERGMQLANGAPEFMDFLKQHKIPFAIATAAGKENIDFYFEHLKLEKWFTYETVVYNDGTFKGKPNPDIFFLAAERIKTNIDKTIIFEDSVNGIRAAENAGAGKIYIVNSENVNYSEWPYNVLTSFDEVDRSLFSSN